MKFILPFCALTLLLLPACQEAADTEEKYVEVERIQEICLEIPGRDDPRYENDYINKTVKRQKANLAATLVYHGVPVRYTNDGRITIPETAAADSAFLQRISAKAKDTAWYRLHLLPRQ